MAHKKEQLNEDLKKYEIGYLVKEETDAEEIKKLLESYKAEILNEGRPRKIRLAYPVKKETGANFGYIQFALTPDLIKDIDQKLKLSQNVLRFLIVNLTAENKQVVETDKKENHSSVAKPEESAKKTANKLEIVDNEQLEKKLEEILK